MFQDFQVLKDNGNGTIDIEVPVYKRMTAPHPTGADGAPLSGKALVLAMQLWIAQNTNSDHSLVDDSANTFNETYGLNAVLDGDVDTVTPTQFPVAYAG